MTAVHLETKQNIYRHKPNIHYYFMQRDRTIYNLEHGGGLDGADVALMLSVIGFLKLKKAKEHIVNSCLASLSLSIEMSEMHEEEQWREMGMIIMYDISHCLVLFNTEQFNEREGRKDHTQKIDRCTGHHQHPACLENPNILLC